MEGGEGYIPKPITNSKDTTAHVPPVEGLDGPQARMHKRIKEVLDIAAKAENFRGAPANAVNAELKNPDDMGMIFITKDKEGNRVETHVPYTRLAEAIGNREHMEVAHEIGADGQTYVNILHEGTERRMRQDLWDIMRHITTSAQERYGMVKNFQNRNLIEPAPVERARITSSVVSAAPQPADSAK